MLQRSMQWQDSSLQSKWLRLLHLIWIQSSQRSHCTALSLAWMIDITHGLVSVYYTMILWVKSDS